jgi:hypothetical protein
MKTGWTMKMFLAIVLCVLSAVDASQAQAPKGSAPSFKIVSKTESAKGLIEFREITYTPVTVSVVRKVVKNGQEVAETVNETRTIPQEQFVNIDATTSRIVTPNGKQLPIDEVWKRVKANSVVVVSGDGNMPDAAYLRVLSAETIVIIPAPPKVPATK